MLKEGTRVYFVFNKRIERAKIEKIINDSYFKSRGEIYKMDAIGRICFQTKNEALDALKNK